MLKRLSIRRFKSIYDSTLDIGRANLFVGVNGTGKSNALEAIGILACALSRGIDGGNLDDRGIRVSQPRFFKSSFRNTDLSPTFRMEAEFENGRYNCSIRSGLTRTSLEFHSEELFDGNVKVFGRGPNGTTINQKVVNIPTTSLKSIPSNRGYWDVLSPFSDISDGLRKELEIFCGYSIYAPQTAIMRGVANDPRVAEPLGLTGSNLATAFTDAIKLRDNMKSDEKDEFDKVMGLIWAPGWANSVSSGSFNNDIVPSQVRSSGIILYIRDKFMKTNRNMLSTFDASEGTLYLIFVAALLLHPSTPKTFALDNVDGTLNSKLVRLLADKIVEVCTGDDRGITDGQHQSFVTSHHPSSLDSYDIFSPYHRIFVARRREDSGVIGSTYFDRIEPPEGITKDDWIRQSQGKNLSNLLLEGLIPGGL